MQFFSANPIKTIRAAKHQIKVLAWHAGALSTIFRLHAPERLGGVGDIESKVEAESRRSGKPFKQVADEVRELTSSQL